MNKTYHFLCGLPRSGSTLLSAILNQHPDVYVTPSSPLLNLLVDNQHAYYRQPEVRANPVPDQLTNITRAMVHATWQHRPEPVIIDKQRGWGMNMPGSTILFEKEIKAIATVRDLPSIMASWLTIIKNNNNTSVHKILVERGMAFNDENILGEMWFNMVKDNMKIMVQLIKDASNRLLIIDYDNLVTNPEIELKKIETFLELPTHTYDFNNITSDTVDDDLAAWGIDGMHKVKPVLKKIAQDPRIVLGDEMYNRFVELEKQYV